MLSKYVLRYVDFQLRDLYPENSIEHNTPFGGKIVLLGGDWKQLGPVVENGTKDDQIFESIKLDPLFKDNFEKLRLVYCF